MQVVFESRDRAGDALRDIAEQRLRFVLRRLTWLVPRARVQLSDINGPRGGLDKQCQIELRTDHSGTVVITAVAQDWRTALERVLARANQVLLRGVRRQSARLRGRHAAYDLSLGS